MNKQKNNFNKKIVFINGTHGYIAKALIQAIKKDKTPIIVIKVLRDFSLRTINNEEVSITHLQEKYGYLLNNSMMINCAWGKSKGPNKNNILEQYKSTLYTIKSFQWAKKVGIKKFIILGSIAEDEVYQIIKQNAIQNNLSYKQELSKLMTILHKKYKNSEPPSYNILGENLIYALAKTHCFWEILNDSDVINDLITVYCIKIPSLFGDANDILNQSSYNDTINQNNRQNLNFNILKNFTKYDFLANYYSKHIKDVPENKEYSCFIEHLVDDLIYKSKQSNINKCVINYGYKYYLFLHIQSFTHLILTHIINNNNFCASNTNEYSHVSSTLYINEKNQIRKCKNFTDSSSHYPFLGDWIKSLKTLLESYNIQTNSLVFKDGFI